MRSFNVLIAAVTMVTLTITGHANAVVILGTGSGALLGNDLTDIGGDGNEGAYSDGTPTIYNIANLHNDTNSVINFGGVNGNFNGNNGYNTINGGAGLGGNDFSVRATVDVTFNVAGTYSIAAASDDGRLVRLTGATLDSVGDQTGLGGAGGSQFGFNNPTGHNQSSGVITVGAGDVVGIDAFMFERGGGDSFEVMIKNGADNAVPGGNNSDPQAFNDGWRLLSNNALGGGEISLGNWNVQAFNINGANGANNTQLNNTNETLVIWDAIDGGQGAGQLSIPNPLNKAGFDALFFSSNEPGFGGGEFAFNVFDDDVGGGNNKWCCGAGGGNPITPQIVGARDFDAIDGKIILTHFTLTSGNDTPGRDPRGFSIQGSNNTTDGLDGDWTDIFVRVDDGTSPWTARNQVLGFGEMFGDQLLTDQGFTAFRMVTTSTGLNGGAFFQINEIEFFGFAQVPEPTTAVLGLLGLAGLARRRRHAA